LYAIGILTLFSLLLLFLPREPLFAKDKDPTLSKLKAEFKIEVTRLDETYNAKNPPPIDGTGYGTGKTIGCTTSTSKTTCNSFA
jgi:hypothetical protein